MSRRRGWRIVNLGDADEQDNEEDPDNIDDLDKQDKPTNQNDPDNTKKGDESGQIDPKEDWTGWMVYVPSEDQDGVDDLLNVFDGEYDRLQYECDWKVRKQLHYYPVLVRHGTAAVESMTGKDFTEAVELLGLRHGE